MSSADACLEYQSFARRYEPYDYEILEGLNWAKANFGVDDEHQSDDFDYFDEFKGALSQEKLLQV